MFLAALLPGLRDLRLPLAVGLTWFVAGWLFFHDRLLQASSTSALGRATRQLTDIIGSGPALSILLFAAYLFGLLVTVNFLRSLSVAWLLRGDYWNRSSRFGKAFNLLDDGRRQNLFDAIATHVDPGMNNGDFIDRMKAYAGIQGDERDEIVNGLMRRVVEEQTALADRLRTQGLRGDEKNEFDEYDRRQSEAEFRQAISFPLAGVVLVLSHVQSIYFLAALIPVFGLWFLGVRGGQAARSYLITTVVEGGVTSDTLQFVRS